MRNVLLNLGKRGLNVNYFANLGAECHFSKLGYSKSNFPKRIECQCNLPFNLLLFKCKLFFLYLLCLVFIIYCSNTSIISSSIKIDIFL